MRLALWNLACPQGEFISFSCRYFQRSSVYFNGRHRYTILLANYITTSRERKNDFIRVSTPASIDSRGKIFAATIIYVKGNLPVTVWLWGRGRVLFPEFTNGGDDRFDDGRALDPPNGLGPIRLFDGKACVTKNDLSVAVDRPCETCTRVWCKM